VSGGSAKRPERRHSGSSKRVRCLSGVRGRAASRAEPKPLRIGQAGGSTQLLPLAGMLHDQELHCTCSNHLYVGFRKAESQVFTKDSGWRAYSHSVLH